MQLLICVHPASSPEHVKSRGRTRGVFRGGMVHGPTPLGRQDSIISIEKYTKLRLGPPLCYLGRKFEHTNGQNLGEDLFFLWSSPNFGPKTGLNLSEDLFFFWSSSNFVQESGLILSEEMFLLVFIMFKFSGPPFRKSCVR